MSGGRGLSRPDWLVAGVFTLLGQLEVAAGLFAGPRHVTAPASALATAALALRRRFPIAPAVAAGAAVAATTLAGVPLNSLVLLLTLVLAVFSLARFAQPPASQIAAALVAALVGLPAPGWSDRAFALVLVGTPWLAGFAIRSRDLRAADLEERNAALRVEAEERERAAIAEERARIARELHDVIAHHISVAVIQLVAAGERLQAEGRSSEEMRAAEQACREALAEMRRLLGVLRPDDASAVAPAPGLNDLDRLLESVRSAGLAVGLEVEGNARQLPAGLDLAAYRIVQEGLTNALKHGRGGTAALRLQHTRDGLEIEILTAGTGSSGDGAGSSGHGTGRGLLGMRERAKLYGGTVEAGPCPDGFRVAVMLPLGGGV